MHAGYRFGVSEFTTTPWPFERDVECYAELGIDDIEICEFKLDRNDYTPQLRMVHEYGLGVSSVQSTIHSLFPDSLVASPPNPSDRVRHIKNAIERIAPHVPPKTPFNVITGAAPGQNVKQAYETALERLAELAAFAADRDMRIAYEPLNPVLFNTDTALWGLDQALELVERIGHPALGLCVDTWNIFQTPDVDAVIERCGERIFLVQVSDWHRPRSGADRISLGDGTIPTAELLRAIRATGYARPYVLEIFSDESLPDSLWRSDLQHVLKKNLANFSTAWSASDNAS